jgi:ubiquinone/menaquinone biosynthesis C-methylase UbiE
MNEPAAPNHHANYPGFSGASGLVAALSMMVGRDDDARFAARSTSLGAGDAVIDIGCGPGVAARYAAHLGAKVTGVDPAPIMLRVARLLTRGNDVHYVEGAAEALPAEDDSASVVWSIASVHHWGDVDAGLREVRRVLGPGGRFIAIERQTSPQAHGHASHGWTDAQANGFADLGHEHGFAGVRIEQGPSRRGPIVGVIAFAP